MVTRVIPTASEDHRIAPDKIKLSDELWAFLDLVYTLNCTLDPDKLKKYQGTNTTLAWDIGLVISSRVLRWCMRLSFEHSCIDAILPEVFPMHQHPSIVRTYAYEQVITRALLVTLGSVMIQPARDSSHVLGFWLVFPGDVHPMVHFCESDQFVGVIMFRSQLELYQRG
mgnify:CR=1 FL=1